MHRTQNPTGTAADTDGLASVTPADILRGASTYILQHGWNRGTYYGGRVTDPFPPACVVGAIGMAAYGNRNHLYTTDAPADQTRLFRRALDYFCDYLGRDEPMCRLTGDETTDLDLEPSPFVWNDDPDYSAAHVVIALANAAKDWDRTHGGAR
ncbi:hypothetical protein AB0M20_32780 [Actinoplanes sp. NPDC051633]|uniref:DUF6197 family protein n=1 Tax=Actinoplanes sp. NPDC051633 TaxID=3155670 RepID=UPI003412C123